MTGGTNEATLINQRKIGRQLQIRAFRKSLLHPHFCIAPGWLTIAEGIAEARLWKIWAIEFEETAGNPAGVKLSRSSQNPSRETSSAEFRRQRCQNRDQRRRMRNHLNAIKRGSEGLAAIVKGIAVHISELAPSSVNIARPRRLPLSALLAHWRSDRPSGVSFR